MYISNISKQQVYDATFFPFYPPSSIFLSLFFPFFFSSPFFLSFRFVLRNFKTEPPVHQTDAHFIAEEGREIIQCPAIYVERDETGHALREISRPGRNHNPKIITDSFFSFPSLSLHLISWFIKVKIKTEVLDEIENFSANDELDIDDAYENEARRKRHKRGQKGRGCPPIKKEVNLDEYVDFEEYIEALTTGKRLICSVCRIEFPDEAEFKTHMVGHSHGKLFQCGICRKQFSRYFFFYRKNLSSLPFSFFY